MVLQNKPNVVQYFLLCITFLMTFFFCSNASALKKQTVGYRYISTLNWTYRQSGGSAVSQTAAAYSFSLIRNISLNATPLKVSYIGQPEIVTSSNIPLRTDRQYHHTIIFFSEIDRPESTLSSALCPRADNTVIDRCEIKELSRENYVQNITQYPDPSGVGQFYAGFGANANNIQMIEIWGHGKSNQDLTSLTYHSDWLYFIQNTNSTLDTPVKLTIYFSPIEIYVDAESPSDEAAEKELESTTNIENQTPQNSSGGSSENQQTTNLIGVFSGFLTQLQSFSATNCNLDLPFPSFIGGTQTVNICQGKDVLGNFITIVGTLAMLTFYIPLAFVLLKMIYNEIRSFTNG